MTTDDQLNEEEFAEEPVSGKKGGMSMLSKVLLALGCGGLLAGLLCCGGIVYFGMNAIQVTEDPQQIAKIQQEVADIELPDSLPPKMGMNMNMFGAFKMKMVGFGDEQAEYLLLMSIEVSGANPADMDQQIRQEANKQMNQQGKEVRITDQETKTLTIDGEEREFSFGKGTMQRDGVDVAVRQVLGSFPARSGAGLVIYIVGEEEWDEARVIEMIQSIRK